jgi:hypothetical protein
VDATNFHLMLHLPDDIRQHGPVYCYWTFPVERINYKVKHTNSSGGNAHQREVIAFRAILKAREVASAREAALREASQGSEMDHRYAVEAGDIFSNFTGNKAGDVNEQIEYRYNEIDRHAFDGSNYSVGELPMKYLSNSKKSTVSKELLNELQICLASHGIACHTSFSFEHSESTLYGSVTFWKGIDLGKTRLDAAEWEGVRSLNDHEDIAASASRLVATPNASYESRPNASRFDARGGRVDSGVICHLFEHTIKVAGKPKTWLYAVISLFQAI